MLIPSQIDFRTNGLVVMTDTTSGNINDMAKVCDRATMNELNFTITIGPVTFVIYELGKLTTDGGDPSPLPPPDPSDAEGVLIALRAIYKEIVKRLNACCCGDNSANQNGNSSGSGRLVYNTGILTAGDVLSDSTPTVFASHYTIPEGPVQNTLLCQHASGNYIPSNTPPHLVNFRWKLIGTSSGTNYLLAEVLNIILSDTPQYYNWSFEGDVIFNSIPGITCNVVAGGILTLQDWTIEHKEWPIRTFSNGITVDNTEPLKLVIEIEWNIADPDNRFQQLQTSVWQETVSPPVPNNAGDAFFTDILRANLQGLMALGNVSPKTLYTIIDAINGTRKIRVFGLTATTISENAENFTTGQYGSYDIGTVGLLDDTFTPLSGASGVITVTDIGNGVVDNTDPANPVIAADPVGTGAAAGAAAVVTANAYTDSQITAALAGLSWKKPARLATTVNIVLSGIQTIDGDLTVAGDRILVKDNTLPVENGVYVVDAGAWTRSTDMDTGLELQNAMIDIAEGTVNANTAWRQTTDNVVIGVSNISWSSVNLNQTLQQVFLAGATMTQDNTWNGAGFRLFMQSFLRVLIQATERVALEVNDGAGNASFITLNAGTQVQTTQTASGVLSVSDSPTGKQLNSTHSSPIGYWEGADYYATKTRLALASVGQIQDNRYRYCSLAGSGTYTGTLAPVITAYVAGMVIYVTVSTANSAASPTVNINSVGAVELLTREGVSLFLGQLIPGYYTIQYDGSKFRVLEISAKDKRSSKISGSNFTNATNVEAPVTGLKLPVWANTSYKGKVRLRNGSQLGGGMRFGFNFPAGGVLIMGVVGTAGSVTAQEMFSGVMTSGVSSSRVFHNFAANSGYVDFEFVLDNGANPGDVELIMRSVNNADTSTINSGFSYIEIELNP